MIVVVHSTTVGVRLVRDDNDDSDNSRSQPATAIFYLAARLGPPRGGGGRRARGGRGPGGRWCSERANFKHVVGTIV